MNKYRHTAIALVLTVILILIPTIGAYANNISLNNVSELKYNEIDSKIPEEAVAFASEHYKEVLEISYPYNSLIESVDWDNYYLGSPYVICDLSNETFEEVYYFPVIYDDKVVLIISIINTTEGWTLSSSTEMVEILNDIQYVKNSTWIFYKEDNQIVAVSSEEQLAINKTVDYAETNSYSISSEKQPYSELIEKLSNHMQKKEVINVAQIQRNTEDIDIIEGYTPSFSTSTSTAKICSLYNAKGQESLPICWAASVATIVNYRLGKNYTAKNVCDKIGTGYVAKDINVKQKALKAYNISYYITTKQLSWSCLTKNIDNKYPVAASTFSSTSTDMGHALTVYGYKMISTSQYITVWDSASNSSKTVYYKSGGSTFTSGGSTYTWTKSLSYIY